jgi:hypothetical protein
MHGTASLTSCNRRHTRYVVGLYSELEIDGLRYGCHVVDLSVSGARVSDVIVAAGEEVTLLISTPQIATRRAIRAVVVWTHGSQAGLSFRELLGT